MSHIDENLIKITEYKVLGRLPDPFLRASHEQYVHMA